MAVAVPVAMEVAVVMMVVMVVVMVVVDGDGGGADSGVVLYGAEVTFSCSRDIFIR